MKKNYVIAVFVLFFVSSYLYAQTDLQSIDKLRSTFDASKFDGAIDFSGTIKDCNQIIEKYKNSRYLNEVYEIRAECNETMGDYDNAIGDYTTSISLKPESYRAYYYRALVYRKQKKFDEAIADLTSAVEKKMLVDSANCMSLDKRAEVYAETGRLELALNDYTKEINICLANISKTMNKNTLPKIYGKRGETYYKLK